MVGIKKIPFIAIGWVTIQPTTMPLNVQIERIVYG